MMLIGNTAQTARRQLNIRKRGQVMKYARMIVEGVISDSPKDFKREKLLLQRAIDKGGDSVLITLDANNGDKTAYIVPTQYLKDLLNEPI